MAHERPASYEHLFDHERNASGSLRLGLLAAAAIHLAVFAITWPTFATTEEVSTDRIIIRPFPIVKYQEPPPSDQRFDVPPRKVPIPDPDPQGPEPITEASPVPVPIDIPEVVLPYFPEAPPVREGVRTPEVVESGIDIDPPRAIHRVEPSYTETALRIRLEGAVILSLIIDTEGRVTEVTVLRGLPFGLTESAVEAARQWRFEPCTFNGEPVRVRMTLTVRFRIAS